MVRKSIINVTCTCLFILVTSALPLSATAATILLDNLANIDANAPVDETRNPEYGILSQVIVGGSDVSINSFSVWGDQNTDGNIKFVIFDEIGFNRVYVSDAITQSTAFDQWFQSPDLNLTLSANNTYYFGLLSDQQFTYHWSESSPALTQNGLTSGQAGISGANGNFNNFADPTMLDNCCFVQNALLIEAVPIPAAIWLFGSGLIGLVGLARRKA